MVANREFDVPADADRTCGGATLRLAGPEGRRLRLAESRFAPTRLEAALLRIHQRRQAAVPPAAAAPMPAPAGEAGASERRAFPRHSSGSVALVYRPAPAGTLDRQQVEWLLHSARTRGTVTDVSMNGVSLLLPEQPARGERMLLRLVNPTFNRPVDVAAGVVRVTPAADGQWKVVCRFQKRLTFEQVTHLGRRIADAVFV